MLIPYTNTSDIHKINFGYVCYSSVAQLMTELYILKQNFEIPMVT